MTDLVAIGFSDEHTLLDLSAGLAKLQKQYSIMRLRSMEKRFCRFFAYLFYPFGWLVRLPPRIMPMQPPRPTTRWPT
jgi:hypothetical protein